MGGSWHRGGRGGPTASPAYSSPPWSGPRGPWSIRVHSLVSLASLLALNHHSCSSFDWKHASSETCTVSLPPEVSSEPLAGFGPQPGASSLHSHSPTPAERPSPTIVTTKPESLWTGPVSALCPQHWALCPPLRRCSTTFFLNRHQSQGMNKTRPLPIHVVQTGPS